MSQPPIKPEQARTDRHVEAFLRALNNADAPPVESLPPAQARQVLTDVQKSVAIDMSGVEESEQIITVDGQPLSLNIFRPANIACALPAFVFFHGGGWVLGDYFTHKRLVCDLVVASGVVGVFVNYTPSPEARYPVAINQAYAATRWVAEHGNAIDVDGTRLAGAGNSVGGNMATVVSLMAKEHGTTLPRLSNPVVARDRREFCHRFLSALPGRVFPDQRHYGMVLGQVHDRSGPAPGNHRLAATSAA